MTDGRRKTGKLEKKRELEEQVNVIPEESSIKVKSFVWNASLFQSLLHLAQIIYQAL